ncbi:MAG: HAMP domain-containing histidine kinase [Acidobacteriota bacterium]|nr:HAMP domain-containing histidine kinase [Acidobacteriota bacterium]
MNKGGESRRITDLPDRRSLWRYFVAVWSVGVAFLLTLLLSPLVRMGVSPLFLAAVMFSAWRGGLGPGLLATLLSVTVSAFIFLPPSFSFAIELDDLLQLGVFSLTAIIISSLSRAREQAETELAASLTREQAARREAEAANELKDEFVAAVSHEMRTPLTTIKTLTRVMLRSEQTAEERRECVEDISSECDRQIDLVLNLLDLSRIKAGNFRLTPQPVKVDEVLAECLKIERFEAEERRQRLCRETLPELPRVVADHSALRRALCGLVENAIKYTPDGGSITLGAQTDGDEVAICITDTGRGIREEDVPRIFDKFYRGRAAVSHNEAASNGSAPNGAPFEANEFTPEDVQMETPGIGLGLYLARNIVEQFGGRITVESEFGRGSTFTVHLPAWHDGANKEKAVQGIRKESEYV